MNQVIKVDLNKIYRTDEFDYPDNIIEVFNENLPFR